MTISLAEARTLFAYDPETGAISWAAHRRRGQEKGARVGFVHKTKGYREISIKIAGKQHHISEHRLAWLLTHGEWPRLHIDHINGVKDDNRLANLRLATKAQNQANTGRYRNNTSGYRGVSRSSQCHRWRASIKVSGRSRTIGYFETKEQAAQAYEIAARAAFGEYVRGQQ